MHALSAVGKKMNDYLPFPQIILEVRTTLNQEPWGTERFHVMNKDEVTSGTRPQIAYNLIEEANVSICFIQSRMECMPSRVISV